MGKIITKLLKVVQAEPGQYHQAHARPALYLVQYVQFSPSLHTNSYKEEDITA